MGESFYTRTTETPPSAFDLSLRPPAFSEFRGQEKIKDRLMLMVEAAKQRDDVLDHILLSGPLAWERRRLPRLSRMPSAAASIRRPDRRSRRRGTWPAC